MVAAFNTWAFKREKPSDLDLVHRFVGNAIESECKIPFVLYWGKGPRSYACAPELDCLNFLTGFAERIKHAYPPGAIIDLVFTDTHARLNGHSQFAVDSYFRDVAKHSDPNLFRSSRLSHCVESWAPEAEIFDAPSAGILDELEKSARKWFRGEATPRQAATRYFAMNMRERCAIEAAFPNAVFITFNGSKFRYLFPRGLPIFYMYSTKKGCAIKPWFMPDPAKVEETATMLPQVAPLAV